jgi:hypothetical protein
MKKLLMVIITLVLVAATASAQSGNSGTCNRACLEDMVNQYLAAMVSHDASKAPIAKDFIFTENAIKLPPTEGLWFTSTGLGDFKFYVSDPESEQVGFVGVVKEHDKPVVLSLRLKIENRQITEAESIVSRNLNEKNLVNLNKPLPAMSTSLAPSERVSREELIRISDLYFDAIEQNNGEMVPWDPECYRLENAMVTASPNPPKPTAKAVAGDSGGPEPIPGGSTCSDGLSSGMLKTIYNIRPRRIPVVDVERGITWGVYCFNHRGVLEVQIRDGSIRPSYAPSPETILIAEIFKIKSGRIRDIVANAARLPYGFGDGWAGPLFK